MKINPGNFGNAVIEPQRAVQASPGAFGAQVGGALSQAGAQATNVGEMLLDQQNQLARAKATNQVLEYDLKVKAAANDLGNQLRDGSLSFDQAHTAYQSALAQIPMPQAEGLGAASLEALNGRARMAQEAGLIAVTQAAEQGKRVQFKGQTDLAMDTLAKTAGLPGSNVESVNNQYDALDAIGQTAYGANWTRVKQTARDNNWYQQAIQRSLANRDNLDGLRQMEGELTAADGFYVGRLDTDKRSAVLRAVQSDVQRLENKHRIESDRTLARGQSALEQVDKQIASGVPAKASDWLQWMAQAAGTPYERDMIDRMKSEQEVQDTLQKPIAEQVAMVREKQATQMTQGANLTDQANLRRLTDAVQTNIKTLADSPLQYAQNRAGVAVEPLAMDALLQPDGAAIIGAQVRDRVNTINALRQDNPGLVQMHPLLPDEAKMLADVLKNAPAGQKSATLGTLYRAFGNPQAYDGAMNQLKDIDPFMARMGLRASSYAQSQLTNNWFSPDVVQSAGDVAAIALHGDDILRTGGKNGTVSYPIPKEQEFMTAIQGKVGNLYRGAGPGDSGAQQFMQDAYAIKAYYVGRAAQEGDTSGVVDGSRMDQAIAAVLGKQVDFHGNGQVLAPWGMSESDFNTRATKALADTFKAAGIQDKVGSHMGNVGLIGVGGGVYFPTLAGTPLADDQGRPLVIRLTPDADTGRDTFGRALSDQIPKDSPK